jgi:hypothetical protein
MIQTVLGGAAPAMFGISLENVAASLGVGGAAGIAGQLASLYRCVANVLLLCLLISAGRLAFLYMCVANVLPMCCQCVANVFANIRWATGIFVQ